MAGTLNKYGQHAGAVVDTVLVAATPVGDRNGAFISDFAVSMAAGGTNGVFQLQVSTDNFVLNIRTKSRLVMTVAGMSLRTFGYPVKVNSNERFRVIFSQGVASAVSAELTGSTLGVDIMD